jgi:hypothetical protein
VLSKGLAFIFIFFKPPKRPDASSILGILNISSVLMRFGCFAVMLVRDCGGSGGFYMRPERIVCVVFWF